MKMRLFLMVFCLLLFAGNASAQENWIFVEMKSSERLRHYLDRNFKVLSNGIVEYRVKSNFYFQGEFHDTGNIEVYWANCMDRQLRLVSAPYSEQNGMKLIILGLKQWRPFDDETGDGDVAAKVCKMLEERNVSKVSNDKKVVKKKVVKRTRKRKQ